MAFILADRVKETTITTGTSNLSLGGAFGGFRTFSSAIGNGNSTYYGIETSDGNYEVGVGTYTSASNTLSRDTVISSSNSGSKISLTGVSTVFVTQPGTKALFVNPDSYASGVSFTGYAFPDGTVQATSATDGAAPAKLRRSNAGVFFQYFVDNGNDRTVALHLENEELTPQWKMGLKNSPSSQTEAPSYGYVFGENGSAGAYADANNAIYINTNNGFWVVHESASVFNVDKSDGSIFKNGTASTPTLTVRGAAAQSAKLQQWETSAESVVASVDNAGKFICQTLQFGDGTSQTKAANLFQGNNISLLTNDAGYITTHTNISAATSVDNSSPNFIQDITLDSNGHVIGITSAASYNHWRLSDDSSGPFNISDNEELKIAGGDNVTTSYNGTHKTLTITATDTNTTYTAGNGLVLAGTEFSAPDVATASGALRQDITSNTAAVSASGYKISGVLQPQITSKISSSVFYNSGQKYLEERSLLTPLSSFYASGQQHIEKRADISGNLQAQIDGISAGSEVYNVASGVIVDNNLYAISGNGGLLDNWNYASGISVSGAISASGYAISGALQAQLANRSNWDTAYGWGNHASAGYLTSQTSHTDVVVDGDFSSEGLMKRGGSAGSYSIVTDNSSNWNTAHGWGNHASAGYLTSETWNYASGVSVSGTFASYAPLANPTFTGTPAAPTASAATNTTQIATTAFVRTEVANLVASAPSALDTLNELAAAINDDASFSTTVTNSIATKIGNVVEDTSPQLGGTLDANSNTIDMGTNVITDTKVGQWDTAYGWGNHASAGYLTSETWNYASGVSVSGAISTSGYYISGILQNQINNFSAGNGLALSSSTFSIADPATLTELTESTDATDDKILLWDEDASTWKYMTLDNLQDSIDTTGGGGGSGDIEGVTAGDGLSGGGTSGGVSLALDLNELTAASVADGDFIAIIDTNDSNASRKEAIHDVATLFAGAGMTATSSVINVIGGDGITANANDVAITAAQTTITSVLNAALVIGRDADNDIDFATDNNIIFRAGGEDQLTLTDGAFTPSTDAIVDLGTSSLQFKDGYFHGTLEADAITVGGTALNTVIAGVTVTNATNAAHVLVTDNESTDEENLITFVEGATSSTGNVGLEMDGNLTYNPSAGRLTATQLAGTLQTAAQANVTSLGTLTTLTVDNVIIDGTTIGHTDDTDLMTLADGVVTVAGEISVTTLDIGGTNVTSTAAELNILDGVTSTAAELNILDGVTSTAAELNILDGVTATATELNYLDITTLGTAENSKAFTRKGDGTATFAGTTIADLGTVTTADINGGTIDGADVTVGSSKTLDVSGGTLTTSDAQKQAIVSGADGAAIDNCVIGGSTAAAGTFTSITIGSAGISEAELEILDGATVTTAEFNLLDGDTSVGGSITLADSDGFIVNDAGTMKTIPASDIKTYAGGGSFNNFTLTADGGSNQTIADGNTLDIAGGNGITTAVGATDTVTVNVDAALTTVTSILATDLKIGEDDQTKIDFEDANAINFYADNHKLIALTDANDGDAVLTVPTADKNFTIKGTDDSSAITALDIDMAAAGDATFNNKVIAAELDISGNADIDGTLEADAYTVDGTALNEYIADTVGAMVGSNTETGIAVSYVDGDNTLDFVIDAAQTTITSILATDLKIGEDDQTKIDFEDADTINFYAGNEKQLILTDGALTPGADNILDLGSSSVEFKDAYFDGTVTSDAFAGPLTGDVTGNADTATALATGRTIGMTGDVVWTSASFTGAGNVTGTSTIQADAIETAMIEDDAVTYAKMQHTGTANRVLGAASAGVIGEVQVATAMIADDAVTLAKMAGLARGKIIVGDSSGNPAALAAGTEDYVLTMDSNGDAVWAAAGGGGGGDITSVVAGDGLTGGATTGDATVNVVGGDGITANANDVAITAAQTTITSVYNASLKMGRDAQNLIDFATTDNKIILRANNINQVSLIDNVFGPEADSDVDLGTSAKRWKDAYVDSITVTGNTDVDGDLDVDGTTNLDAVDIDGNVQIDGTLTVGVDDTGKDVKFFGATAGSYLEWDESADRLHLVQGAFVNQPVPATGGTNSGDTLQIDLSKGNYHNITLNNHVGAIEFQNATIGQKFIIRFTQESTARTVFDTGSFEARINGSVAAELKWAGNVVPTMSTSDGHKDVYGFLCTATGSNANDTKFDGFIIGQDIPN